MSVKFVSVPAKILKTDITSSDSTFKLRDIVFYTGSDGTPVDLATSDFGATGYGCWEPRTSRQEFFTWTTSTLANYATTGITIAARGLPWGSDYTTEAAARKFSHPSGSQVLLFTDAPGMWNTIADKENNETITGLWTFVNNANYPKVGTVYAAPTDDLHIATKKYADDLAIAGAPDATTTVKGLVEIGTAAENAASTATGSTGATLVVASQDCTTVKSAAGYANKIPVTGSDGKLDQSFLDLTEAYVWSGDHTFSSGVFVNTPTNNDGLATNKVYVDKFAAFGTSGEAVTVGDALYLKAADGKLWKADTDADESTYSFVGVSLEVVAAADTSFKYARPGGIVPNITGLTAGSYYYISGTAGTLSTSANATRPAKVAQAISTTSLRVIEPKFVRRGLIQISATGDTTTTIGFYPAVIRINAIKDQDIATTLTRTVFSIGDDSNRCIAMGFDGTNVDGGYTASYAFSLVYDASTSVIGTVSNKNQTTFRISSTVANSGTAALLWEAESM